MPGSRREEGNGRDAKSAEEAARCGRRRDGGDLLTTCQWPGFTRPVYSGLSDPIEVLAFPTINLSRRAISTFGNSVRIKGRLHAVRVRTAGKLTLRRVLGSRTRKLRTLRVDGRGRFSGSVRLATGTYTLRVVFTPNTKHRDYFYPVQRDIDVVIRERHVVVARAAVQTEPAASTVQPPTEYPCNPTVRC